jgi:transposase-like protein
MGTARRHFTDEFRREAVRLLASGGRPSSEIARELVIAAALEYAGGDPARRRGARG